MAKAKATTDLGKIAHSDLLYAMRALVRSGKTTALEVTRLATERTSRIASLKAELATLEAGEPLPAKSAGPVRRKRGRPKAKAAPTTKPVGSKIVRSDGRKFTVTAAVRKARKIQGQYLGHLRQIPEKERPKFKAIAKDKGVPAAIAAIKKRLGKS